MDFTALMPGKRRIRDAHALPDGTGAWPLIYDLERAVLIDVPDEYQYHINAVLETGELDDGLIGWMTGNDLLTVERGTAPSAVGGAGWGSGGGGIGGVFVAGGAVHCHPGTAEPSAEVLAFPFETMAESPVVLHLTLEPGGDGALRRTVLTAARLAASASRPLSFRLSGAAEVLDDRLVGGLAELAPGHCFGVRLSCPPVGADGRLRASDVRLAGRLARVAEVLGPRLSVHVRLGRRDRLGDLWRWAGTLPLERLDAVKTGERPEGEHGSRSAEAQDFRGDLTTICEEMLDGLGQHRPRPLLYEPVTRVVRRLAAGPPAPADEGGFLAVIRDGRLILCTPLPAGARLAPPAAEGLPLPGDEPCTDCWARHLCVHSVTTRSAEAAPAEEPREDRCELWRDEVTAALFFYRRLQEVDPDGLLGLGSTVRGPAPAHERPSPSPPAAGPSWVF